MTRPRPGRPITSAPMNCILSFIRLILLRGAWSVGRGLFSGRQ